MVNKKVTWNDVYKDFKQRYPKLSQKALGFKPYNYATILLLFPNRVRMLYNYDTRQVTDINVDVL